MVHIFPCMSFKLNLKFRAPIPAVLQYMCGQCPHIYPARVCHTHTDCVTHTVSRTVSRTVYAPGTLSPRVRLRGYSTVFGRSLRERPNITFNVGENVEQSRLRGAHVCARARARTHTHTHTTKLTSHWIIKLWCTIHVEHHGRTESHSSGRRPLLWER